MSFNQYSIPFAGVYCPCCSQSNYPYSGWQNPLSLTGECEGLKGVRGDFPVDGKHNSVAISTSSAHVSTSQISGVNWF